MKIFVIYATAGIGHKKAAEAIFNGLKQRNIKETKIIDSLDYTNSLFKFVYTHGYIFLIKHLPTLWGFFYWLTDNSFLRQFIIFCRTCCNFLNSRRLSKFLSEQQPDIIVSTHFFINQVISWLKKANRLNARLICVITDYVVHSFWLADGVDIYAVANQRIKDDLISRGVKEEKIKITGIPVSGEFLKSKNKQEICKKLNIKYDTFTVLIVTGAIGVGPIAQIIKALKYDAQILVVCGKNRKLFEKLIKIKSETLKVFSLIDNMHELMAISNIVITKAGGLTISESLVQSLPIIFFNLIPGQEMRNAELIEEMGAGIIARDVKKIKEAVVRLKNNPQEIEKMKYNIVACAKYEAVNNVLELIK